MNHGRRMLAGVIGLISGALMGLPSGYLIGSGLVQALKVSSFEGGRGYAVLAVMMIVIPAFSVVLAAVNEVRSKHAWPSKLIAIEASCAVLSGIICVAVAVVAR